MQNITYELRRYTNQSGYIGERVMTCNKLREVLVWLRDVIMSNKYECQRDGYTFIVESSPYSKQTKVFRIFKIVGGGEVI